MLGPFPRAPFITGLYPTPLPLDAARHSVTPSSWDAAVRPLTPFTASQYLPACLTSIALVTRALLTTYSIARFNWLPPHDRGHCPSPKLVLYLPITLSRLRIVLPLPPVSLPVPAVPAAVRGDHPHRPLLVLRQAGV